MYKIKWFQSSSVIYSTYSELQDVLIMMLMILHQYQIEWSHMKSATHWNHLCGFELGD